MTRSTAQPESAVSPRRAGARSAGGPGAGKQRIRWGRITPLLLIAPAVIFELLIHVVPMFVGIAMSFIQLTQFFITNWLKAPFAGLANYRVAVDFTNPLGRQLLDSFGWTLAFTVLTVGLSYLFGMAAAIVLQRAFPGRGVLRTLFLIPYALPAYAGIITWKFILQRDTGMLNELLVDRLGLFTDNPPFWLLGGNSFVALVIVAVWQQWPFAFLMLMAGMQSIPEDLYQAAAIDGAGAWRQVRYITLGLTRPISMVLILLLFLWTFREFNTPFVLFGAAPPEQVNLLVVNIYNSSFLQWNFGRGSAMSVLLMIFLVLVSGLWVLINRRVARDA